MPSPPLSPNSRLRLDLINRALDRMEGVQSVVEVGCGQGGMAYRLASRFSYRGYEPDPQSHRVSAARVGDRGQVTQSNLPSAPDRQFDLLVAFEVIEHVEDDAGALASWAAWVRPGGHILLSTPANPRRFGPWDRAVGHYRRYTRDQLGSLLSQAGFQDLDIGIYGFPLGYVLEAVRNRLAGRHPETSKGEATAGSGRALQPWAWQGRLIDWGTWPFRLVQRPLTRTELGTGWVVSARLTP